MQKLNDNSDWYFNLYTYILIYISLVLLIIILYRLACVSGSIVVLSIHQPRYSIFKLFKSLTLLSRGKVVFHGPAKKTLSYFDRIGEVEISA